MSIDREGHRGSTMRLGAAVAEYQETRQRVRWMTRLRLRRMERKGRDRALGGQLGDVESIRLAAIRDELTARGEQLEPVYRGLP